MNLYEINKQMAEAWEKLQEAGEAEFLEQFEKLELERNEKISNTALLIKNLRAIEAAIGDEVKALNERKKAAQNKINNLEKWLMFCLKDGEKYQDARCKISWLTTKETVVPDEDLVPDLYCKIERKVSKSEIKKDLQAGVDLPFAYLVENKNLIIK